MAADFYKSSQKLHWLLTRSQLDQNHKRDLDFLTPKQYQLVRIYLYHLAQRLGRRLGCRQQAVATACVYISRFYSKASIRETNPYLVVATCIYIACKMEECPSHIRTVVTEARQEWAEHISSDTTKLAECEFYVIEEMSAYMIVHHPYRTLQQISDIIGLPQQDIVVAWTIINDTYASDLPLLYLPHIIALSALYMAFFTTSQSRTHVKPTSSSLHTKLVELYAQSGIDMDAIAEVTQEIISLYQVWSDYKAKDCKVWLEKILGSRSLENGNGKY